MGFLRYFRSSSDGIGSIQANLDPNNDDLFTPGCDDGLPARAFHGADGALQVSAVYQCVMLRAKMAGMLPLRMYKRDGEAIVEAPDHPLNELLEYQPNKWQTAYDFKAMMQMHLDLRGNAYAEIKAGRRGFADRLEPIHPDRMNVERLSDGNLRYTFSDERGQRKSLLQDEVFHIRSTMAPGIVGISPIAFARNTIGLALNAETYGNNIFRNGARPSGVVQVKKTMSDKAFERFKSQWRNMYTGVANAGSTPILEEEAEFKPISMSADDAQFILTRQHQVEEICRWFDVPPVMLHHITNQTSWGTGVEAVMLAFFRNNLKPTLDNWIQVIRRDLIIAPQVYEARWDLEDMIAGDSKTMAEVYSRYVLNGIMTRNEARQKLGYNPLPGLDKPIEPNNQATSDKLPGNGGGQRKAKPANGAAITVPELHNVN